MTSYKKQRKEFELSRIKLYRMEYDRKRLNRDIEELRHDLFISRGIALVLTIVIVILLIAL